MEFSHHSFLLIFRWTQAKCFWCPNIFKVVFHLKRCFESHLLNLHLNSFYTVCITYILCVPWSLLSYLKAWVRQNCQLAFSSATTTTFPSSSCMGACPFISQWGAGLQIAEPWSSPSTIRLTCEAHSRPGRAAYSHSDERECIVPPWVAPLNLPDKKDVK